MKLYLAYGSNLNKHQMQFRCPDAEPVGTTKITGYRLVFRRGVLTIEPSRDGFVPVAIWKISEVDERSLDRYEGFPHFYVKRNFLILFSRKENGVTIDEYQEAMAYVMNDGYRVEQPSMAYMRTCTQGYKDFGLNTAPLMKAYRESKGGDA